MTVPAAERPLPTLSVMARCVDPWGRGLSTCQSLTDTQQTMEHCLRAVCLKTGFSYPKQRRERKLGKYCLKINLLKKHILQKTGNWGDHNCTISEYKLHHPEWSTNLWFSEEIRPGLPGYPSSLSSPVNRSREVYLCQWLYASNLCWDPWHFEGIFHRLIN